MRAGMAEENISNTRRSTHYLGGRHPASRRLGESSLRGGIMGAMKRYAEGVSVDMGFDGEINETVLIEAQRRLNDPEVKARRE